VTFGTPCLIADIEKNTFSCVISTREIFFGRVVYDLPFWKKRKQGRKERRKQGTKEVRKAGRKARP
jgi:tricorn protease-like protein